MFKWKGTLRDFYRDSFHIGVETPSSDQILCLMQIFKFRRKRRLHSRAVFQLWWVVNECLDNDKCLKAHKLSNCVPPGDSDRTLVQKFDCGPGREFLHGFKKTNGSLNLMLACSKINEANVTLLTYESGFPIGQQRNRLARTNWEEIPLDVTCGSKNEIICGLDIAKPTSRCSIILIQRRAIKG